MLLGQTRMEKDSTKNVYNNPGYFGAFLNMAVLNVFAISNQVVKTFKEINGDELLKDSDIKRSDKNLLLRIFNGASLPSELKMNVLIYLDKRQHFPVFKYFLYCYNDEENQEYYNNESKLYERTHQFLQQSFNALVDLRNDFTHFIAVDRQGNEVEKKYKVAEQLTELLQQKLLYASIDFSLERFKETQIKEDFDFVKYINLIETDLPKLTEQGLFFFISMFLERGNAWLFLKKLTGFKNETTPSFKATLKVFSAFCLKLPKEKLENVDYKQSLLMQILPELAKCPPILYNRLSETDKQKFQPEISEEAKRNLEYNSINYENIDLQKLEKEIGDLVNQKRRSDRFHYFALRFLDELEVFKRVRFQIKLGRLMFSENDVRSKELLGKIQPRKITKTVCAFGKLAEFENNTESKIIEQFIGYTDSWGFDQFAPHYNMQNNKIAFSITDQVKYPILKKEDEKANEPDGFLSLHLLPKLVLTAILEPEKLDALIEDFFDKNNDTILNIETLYKIKDKLNFGSDPKELTRKLIDYNKNTAYLENKEKIKRTDYTVKMKNRNEKLNEELKKYNLHHSQLPGVVKDYLLNIKKPSIARSINTFLKAERLAFKQSLKKIDKQRELKHKIKLGELATTIARDIMNMLISEQLKQQLTPPYINKIQNAIAHFGLKKDELIEMLTEWKILDQQIGHCFLTKDHIKNSHNVIEFYENYVNEKIKYIDKIKSKTKTVFGIDPNTKLSIKLPYKYRKLKEKYKEKTIEGYVKQKQKVPVNLPLNLFDETLFAALRENISTEKTGLNNLLATYLKQDLQLFYNFKRVYNIDKEPTTVDVNGKTLKEIKAEFGKPVFENEKKIRYQQMIDRVMKMMCIELMQKQEDNLELEVSQLKLANLSNATPDKNFLNAPVVFKRAVGQNKILIASDNKTSKQKVKESIAAFEAHEKSAIEHWYSWTVKDYGRFNRLIVDRRLPNLLNHFEHETIPVSIIMHELKSYDNHWHLILEELLKVEKAIFEKDKVGIKQLQLGSKYEHIQFNKYEKWLNMRPQIIYKKDFIKHVRNKFSHSQFVDINSVGLNKITNETANEFNENYQKPGWVKNDYKSIAEQVYEKFNAEIDNILKQIAVL